MKDGFGYGGAPGLVNAIPAFLALRKKLDKPGGKPVVQEYQGVRQVSLELETMRVKEAPEARIDLYRIGDSPLLSLKPAEGLTLAAVMVRVIELVEKYCQRSPKRDPGFSPNRDPSVIGDTNASTRADAAGRGCGGGARAGSLGEIRLGA
jgi:hypothetical protein